MKMTSFEKRAVFSLSTIMSLRMIGLFMALPILSSYASTHFANSSAFLIGILVGIYGLPQALLQIPFGILSDKFGRKPLIFIGLLIFIAGSLVCFLAPSIYWMILGRALQGAGAIGSTILAMIADLTREEQRSKSMAIVGISIGFSFTIAMFLGPLIVDLSSINNLLLLTMGFRLLALRVLLITPTPQKSFRHLDTEPGLKSFFKLLRMPELTKLNLGIFILHAVFTASFVIIPIQLKQLVVVNQWCIYLPTLIIASILSLICIGLAERKQQLKFYYLGGIIMLVIAQSFLWMGSKQISLYVIGLGLFFFGFSLLEAFLPSLISQAAPITRKGTALGIYSCSQFLGIFVGGLFGGWLFGQFGFAGAYLFCLSLILAWLVVAYFMQPPSYLTTLLLRISVQHQINWESIAMQLRALPGVIELQFIPEDSLAYIKLKRSTAKNVDFIRLKEQLQSE